MCVAGVGGQRGEYLCVEGGRQQEALPGGHGMPPVYSSSIISPAASFQCERTSPVAHHLPSCLTIASLQLPSSFTLPPASSQLHPYLGCFPRPFAPGMPPKLKSSNQHKMIRLLPRRDARRCRRRRRTITATFPPVPASPAPTPPPPPTSVAGGGGYSGGWGGSGGSCNGSCGGGWGGWWGSKGLFGSFQVILPFQGG